MTTTKKRNPELGPPYKLKGKDGVFRKLDLYRKADQFAVFAVLNEELNPDKVFKWADNNHGTVAMTFKNYIPKAEESS